MHRRHSHIARVRMLCAVVPSDIRLATRAAREAVQVARCHHEHRPRGHRCEKDEHWEQMALDGRAEPEGARKHACFCPGRSTRSRAAFLGPVRCACVGQEKPVSARKMPGSFESLPRRVCASQTISEAAGRVKIPGKEDPMRQRRQRSAMVRTRGALAIGALWTGGARTVRRAQRLRPRVLARARRVSHRSTQPMGPAEARGGIAGT